MSDHHQLGVYADQQSQIEGVDGNFIRNGLLLARERTIQVMEEIRGALTLGMNETEARELALALFAKSGVKKHWHKPWVRFGAGTVLSFYDPVSEERLKENDVFHFDLGPVWPAKVLGLDGELEYEADYGDTFVFGKDPDAEKMISALHETFAEIRENWRGNQATGNQMYAQYKSKIEERGYVFIEKVDGHRIGDFPHQKYTRTGLSKISFVPTSSLWILEAMIHHPQRKIGAFFEDILS